LRRTHYSYLSPGAGKLGTTRGWVWRVNAKGPVSDNGAFRTFLHWRGMLSDPTAFSIRHALIWFQKKGGGGWPAEASIGIGASIAITQSIVCGEAFTRLAYPP